MKNAWIVEVLRDLESFAVANQMDKLLGPLEEAKIAAILSVEGSLPAATIIDFPDRAKTSGGCDDFRQ